jgi:saccharopine dehydrogenase-like NADP-dependent oxidoreductase
VSTVLVAGLGQVGVRAARQLLDTPGIERVLVAARDLSDAREAARSLHDGAEPIRLVPGDAFP